MGNLMAQTIPDLWPEYVQPNVLSPATILKFQAAQLRAKTNHVLEAEVVGYRRDIDDLRAELESDAPTIVGDWPNPYEEAALTTIVLHFELVAPLMAGHRVRLFQAKYTEDAVYPVGVYQPEMMEAYEWANTQEEFVELIKKVLNSGHTKALIQSLLAQINERDPLATPVAEKPVSPNEYLDILYTKREILPLSHSDEHSGKAVILDRRHRIAVMLEDCGDVNHTGIKAGDVVKYAPPSEANHDPKIVGTPARIS